MKTRKIVNFLVLLAMSFSTLHAYAIDLLDSDHCEVSEYVQEFSQPGDHDQSGDICQIHHEFHIAFVMPEVTPMPNELKFSGAPFSTSAKHDFQSLKNFLRPPITLS